VAKGHG
jgi:D-alanyl-D-alanine carboxypeptidase (penicillin-binding protein 5/6)